MTHSCGPQSWGTHELSWFYFQKPHQVLMVKSRKIEYGFDRER